MEKTSTGNFLGKFSYTFSTKILWSTEYATVFSIKNKFSRLTCYFDILIWFSSVILLSKMKSFFLNLYTSPQWVNSILQLLLRLEVCTNLQIKRFPLMKFRYTIWIYGVSDTKRNNIEKDPSRKYLLFLGNCLSRHLLIIRANNHNLVLIITEKFKKISQNSWTLFLNIIPWYQQIKILQ